MIPPPGMRRRALPLLALAALAPGAEVPVADVRLVVEARPTAFSFTWNGPGLARAGDDAFDRAWGAGLGWRQGLAAPGSAHQALLGGEALWIDEAFGSGGRRGALLRGEAGWGWSPADTWLFSGGIGAGVGYASFALPGGASGDQRLPGWLLEAGPRAGARWSLRGPWSVEAEAGWLVGRDRHRDGDLALDLRRSGGWFSLSLAWTLDRSPRAVE